MPICFLFAKMGLHGPHATLSTLSSKLDLNFMSLRRCDHKLRQSCSCGVAHVDVVDYLDGGFGHQNHRMDAQSDPGAASLRVFIQTVIIKHFDRRFQ